MADISEDDLFQGLDISEDDLFEGTTEEEKGLIARTVFPTSTSMEMGDVKSFAKRTLQAGIDASTFPTRLLGMLRGFDIADPKSAALQPEIEKFEESTNVDNKIQEFADAAQRAEPGSLSERMMLARMAEFQALKDEGKERDLLSTITSDVMREGPTLLVGGIAKKGLKVAERAAKSGIATAQRFVEDVTALSEDAVQFIKKGSSRDIAELEKFVGKADEISQRLKGLVFDKPEKFFPENQLIQESLQKLPPIPLKQTIKTINTEIAHLKKLGGKTNRAAITKLENLLDDVGSGRIVGGGTQRIPGKVTQEAAATSPTTINIPGRVTKEGVMLPPTTQTIPGKTIAKKTDNMGRVIQPKSTTQPTTISSRGREVSPELRTQPQTQNIPGQQIRGEIKSPGTTITTKGKQVFNRDAAATLFRDQRDMIDDLIDWTEKPGLKEINKSLIKIRTSMANEMLTQAVKSGDKVFEKNMKSLAKKLKAIDKLKLRLGSEETFVATLFGKNKSARQRALKEIDEVFGTDFSKESNLAKIASEFRKNDFTTVDGKVALSVPRGKNALGKVISPRAAAGISNLADLSSLRVLGQLPSELAASGITQAQIGSLINFFEGQGTTP